MSESKWLLIIVGVINLLFGISIFYGAQPDLYQGQEAIDTGVGIGFIALIYIIAAIAKSYWFRFVCISLWVTDLFATNIILGRMRPVAIIFFLTGIILLYKMWKYRNNKRAPLLSD